MRWLAVIVLCAGVASASPRATDADAKARLESARSEIRAHMHALRYAQARDAATAAMAIGAAGKAEVAELARALGETSAALDDAEAAERWFAVWLMLDPVADLPPGTSPKLTAPLARARGRIGGALSARVAGTTVEIAGDPDQHVAVVELATTDARGDRAVRLIPLRRAARASPDGRREPIELGTSVLTAVDVSLRDAHGNELLASHEDVVVPIGPGPGPGPGPRPPARSFLRRPLPYVVGAAITAGLGGVFLWRRSIAKDDLADILAASEQHTFAEAEDARARAERHGWLSVASFAATGVLAATAIYFATRGDGEQPVLVAPLPGGGATVLFATRF